jgi:hypothetical protein
LNKHEFLKMYEFFINLMFRTFEVLKFWINFGKFFEFWKVLKIPHILGYECFLNVINKFLSF